MRRMQSSASRRGRARGDGREAYRCAPARAAPRPLPALPACLRSGRGDGDSQSSVCQKYDLTPDEKRATNEATEAGERARRVRFRTLGGARAVAHPEPVQGIKNRAYSHPSDSDVPFKKMVQNSVRLRMEFTIVNSLLRRSPPMQCASYYTEGETRPAAGAR